MDLSESGNSHYQMGRKPAWACLVIVVLGAVRCCCLSGVAAGARSSAGVLVYILSAAARVAVRALLKK